MITIDGGQGEGGGQVLRTALAVSASMARPFVLERVRHNRKPPGLKAQHLACVLACAKMSGAEVEGAHQGSNRVVFRPGRRPEPGSHRFEIGTAGATALLLHAVAFPLWLAAGDSEVVLTGGTHVDHAPSFDDLELGWAPLLARAGFPGGVLVRKTGFYPRGGGEIVARLDRARPCRLELATAGAPLRARAVARVASLPREIGERLVERARARLEKRLALPVETRVDEHVGSPGCAVTVALELANGLLVARGLGERGKPAARVADEAADALLADLEAGGAVDEHLADQLLLPLALGQGGVYRVPRVTEHLTTNVLVLERILPEARVRIESGPEGTAALVHVHGAGVLG